MQQWTGFDNDGAAGERKEEQEMYPAEIAVAGEPFGGNGDMTDRVRKRDAPDPG